MKKYSTIDLCAGIGGIRKGFELTGRFENVLSAEIDLAAAKTYKHLFGDDPLNDLTSSDFKNKVHDTKYDVLLAGFPCQTFSSAGNKMGFKDKIKGTIFFDIVDIIADTNPKAIFLENVENLISHDNGDTIEIIISVLEELNYHIIGLNQGEKRNYKSAFVRNSKDFGVPQNRPRVYIMAFSKEIYGNDVFSLGKNTPREGKKIYEDLNDILDTNVDDKYYISEGYLETLRKHKTRQKSKGNGFGYSIVNFKETEHPIAHTILATGGSGKERNLIYQPKDGVGGKQIPGKRSPLNSEGVRFMTPTEWGRLQGFIGYAFVDQKTGVDKFDFPEGTNDGQKYKQFGNSVSIPVIEAMASFMLECLDKLEG